MPTLQVVERNTPSMFTRGSHPARPYCWGWKRVTPCTPTLPVVERDTLHVYCTRLPWRMDTPCTSTGLAVVRIHLARPSSILLVVQRDTPCKPILHGGWKEIHPGSPHCWCGKRYILLLLHVHNCLWCKDTSCTSNCLWCKEIHCTMHIHTSCCTKRYLYPSLPYFRWLKGIGGYAIHTRLCSGATVNSSMILKNLK